MPGRTLSLATAVVVLMISSAAGQSMRDLTIEEMGEEYRVALVIGNGAYAEAPLRNPPNDARAMAAALRNCGFEVDELIDSDRREMIQAIRDFGRKIQHGGVGLFYFAGHGMQVKGRNFLIPVKADIQSEDEVEFESIDAAQVLSKMERVDNRVNIVILDACRNNPFARSFRSSSRGLAQMQSATGSLIAYATAPGKIAADGEGENGLYTEKLLKFINTPGLNIEQVFKNVRQDVMGESGGEQTPWEASSLTGSFFFVLPEEAAVPPVADAGPDRTANLNEVVRLDGSGSLDPEGEDLAYAWEQQGGPDVALLNGDTAHPSFTGPQEGVYRFALVVNDGQQDSEPDEVVVQVVQKQAGSRKWIWWVAGAAGVGGAGYLVIRDGNGGSDPDTGAIDFEIPVP